MVTKKRQTWEAWPVGDHGVIAPLRAPRGSYSGLDALVYADGSLGPRCGVAEVSGEGIPPGVLAGLGFYSLSAGAVPDAWFCVGAKVYRDPAAPVELSGSLASVPTRPLGAQPVGNRVYITSAGDKTYEVTSSAVSPVSSSPGGTVIALYGERLLVAGDPSNPNRVYYTDPLPDAGTPATFPTLGYFQVGRGASIVGLWVIRNLVYIALDDGTWWVYTGVPGVSDTLRLAYSGMAAPAGPQAGAVIGANAVWFVAEHEHFPSYFNGSTVTTFDDQDTEGRLYGPSDDRLLPAVTVVPISRRGDMLCLAGAGLTGDQRVSLLLREDRWSRHSISPCVAVPVPGGGGLVLLSDGGGPGAPPRFFLWQATGFDRPPDGAEYRPIVDPGIGPVEAEIRLPEVLSDNGAELHVRSVTVDARVHSVLPPPSVLRLPGETGNYVSTPDVGVLDITGDIDLRARVGADDWTPGADQALVAKWRESDDERSYMLMLNSDGELELVWSTDGTSSGVLSVESTADLTGLAGGAVRWVRATMDVDNGSAQRVIQFFTSPDGSVWTQLGSTVTESGATSIYSGAAPVEVGSSDEGTDRLFVGQVYEVQVRAGISGTVVASPDFTRQAAGALGFIDGAARPWTVHQAGTLFAEIRADATPAEIDPVGGFELAVEATRLTGDVPGVRWSRSHAYTVRADAGSEEGTAVRFHRQVGDQGPAGGFRVHLSKVRGVAIERVQVEYDEKAAVP